MAASPSFPQPAVATRPVLVPSAPAAAKVVSPEKTALRVKTTVIAGMLAGILLSPKLWVSTRYYPLVPALPHLPAIPYPLDYLCYGALIVLLVAAAFVAPAACVSMVVCGAGRDICAMGPDALAAVGLSVLADADCAGLLFVEARRRPRQTRCAQHLPAHHGLHLFL